MAGLMIVFSFVLLTVNLLLPGVGQAKDLGTIGATYSISERDAVEEMQERAKQVDWQKLFDKKTNKDKLKKYHPKDLVLLPRAQRGRTRMVDMSYTLDFDIPDERGNIIYPAGYTFNPLDYITYPRTIVIINGADREQVDWFKKAPYFKDSNAVLWITDGNYYDLSVELKRNVFYANSFIVQKFKLSYVPSVIKQKGNLLEVKEIDVESHRK